VINRSKNQVELYVLGRSKDLIIKKIISDVNITNLIDKDISPPNLIHNNIFDTLVIDLTQNEAKTYITMDAIVSSVENKHIKSIDIIVNIFTHLSLKRLSRLEQEKYYTSGFFGNRIDVLADLVVRMLDGSKEFGIGELGLRPRNPISIIQPTSEYYGKSLVFQTFDFN